MPYKIKLSGAPIGYAVSTALEGEEAAVQVRGFLCFDQPMVLLAMLESYQASVLAFLPPATSGVGHAAGLMDSSNSPVMLLTMELPASAGSAAPTCNSPRRWRP
jgi:hypothetical protein